MTDTAPTDPAAGPADDPRSFDDSLDGSIMEDIRADLEARLAPILEPEPEPDRWADDPERDRLLFENQLLKLSGQYPREVAVIQKMLEGGSIEDYVTTLATELRPRQPEPEQEVSDVDRNNPPGTVLDSIQRAAEVIHLPDGRVITRAEGIQMLEQASSLHG